MNESEVRGLLSDIGDVSGYVDYLVGMYHVGDKYPLRDVQDQLLIVLTFARRVCLNRTVARWQAPNLQEHISLCLKSIASWIDRIKDVAQAPTGHEATAQQIANDIASAANELRGVNNNNHWANVYRTLDLVESLVSRGGEDEARLTDYIERAEESVKRLEAIKDTWENEIGRVAPEKYVLVYSEKASKYSRAVWGDKSKDKNNIDSSKASHMRLAPAQFFFGLGTLCVLALVASAVWVGSTTVSEVKHLPALVHRLAILSVAAFAVRYSFRQYSINKHIASIYEQKADALASFPLLFESLSDDDPETKNEILAEVARAIFTYVDPGFVDKGGGDSSYGTVLSLKQMVSSAKDK